MSESDINDSEIQKLLKRIREKSSQGEYVYRGEPQKHDKIPSGLYRKYAKEIDAKEFDIQIAQTGNAEKGKGIHRFYR